MVHKLDVCHPLNLVTPWAHYPSDVKRKKIKEKKKEKKLSRISLWGYGV